MIQLPEVHITDLPLSEIEEQKLSVRDLAANFWCQSTSMDELATPLDNIIEHSPAIQNLGAISERFKNELTPKEKSALNLFLYLSMTEGLFSELLNIIIFMHVHSEDGFSESKIMPLRKNSHKCKNCGYIKENEPIKTYKEIRELNLGFKLKYLEKLDIRHQYFIEYKDRKIHECVNRPLRNAIAHLDFTIKDDGTVLYGTKRKPVNSEIEIKELMANIGCISSGLQFLIQEIRKKPKR